VSENRHFLSLNLDQFFHAGHLRDNLRDVELHLSSHYVARVLDRAVPFRGKPGAIRTDQGPEFTAQALDQLAYRNGAEGRAQLGLVWRGGSVCRS